MMIKQKSKKRILLPVKRWKQHTDECGICTVASVANYYDPAVSYQDVRRLIPKRQRSKGLWTPQQARLLNELGFGKVSIVTFDVEMFDFSWNRLTNRGLLSRLHKAKKYYDRKGMSDSSKLAQCYIEWLEIEGCENRVIVDNDLPKYIRRHLNMGRPVAASYNSTSMWKQSKGGMRGDKDIKGETFDHAVVIRGYDDVGLFIVDSDDENGGYYKVKWQNFLINVRSGDLILVS